jgi:uncharacterized protein YkwD
VVAIASVLLVITPISWILLHQPQNDDADASEPLVTRTDDTYITPSTKPVIAPPSEHASTPPTAPPTATPTGTPTDSVTPTTTPTDVPTDTPTDVPTSQPTDNPSTANPTNPTTPGRTLSTGRPIPTETNTTTTAPPPPPPPVDGQMQPPEKQLFDMIDNARVNNGCARLKQDPGLTGGARDSARDRASSGNNLSGSGGSRAGAGGDRMSPQDAYTQMMSRNKGTILNCGFTTLGVGTGSAPRETGILCPVLCTGSTARNAWVADFS